MNTTTRLASLNRFRNTPTGLLRQSATKVLVVYDVQVKNPEVPHVPLIINYGKFSWDGLPHKMLTTVRSDLPKAVEEYAHRYDGRHSLFFSLDLTHFFLIASPLPLHRAILVQVLLSTSLLLLVETLRCSGP